MVDEARGVELVDKTRDLLRVELAPIVPYIPETITVHLGAPDAGAENVTVSFSDYVKNVLSSEVYPTWEPAALRANALAARALAVALADVEAAAQGSGKGLPARFVLVSSLAATGPSDCPPGVADNAVPAPVSAYGWSKLLVEQILGRALGDRLVTLRPPIIYGSGDKGLLPVFKGAARGFAVSPGAFRDFPVSAVHARDMAQAVLLCCKDTARGVYHINDGGLYSMAHFCRVMGAALGRPRLRVIHLPLPLMAVTAGLASSGGLLWARLSRCLPSRAPQRAPNWNLDKYREARQAGWLCDAARIRRELGYEPRVSLAEGMAEAVEGYRREGWL